MSADAYHMTSPLPDGSGAARAMEMAIKHARINPDEVDYINAHGTSTGIGDVCETKAIKKVFGQHAMPGGVLVSSTKSMHGHALGAAGALEAVASILTLRHGILPPTANFNTADPECDLDVVPNVARATQVEACLSNSFAFGGLNAVLAFKAYR